MNRIQHTPSSIPPARRKRKHQIDWYSLFADMKGQGSRQLVQHDQTVGATGLFTNSEYCTIYQAAKRHANKNGLGDIKVVTRVASRQPSRLNVYVTVSNTLADVLSV